MKNNLFIILPIILSLSGYVIAADSSAAHSAGKRVAVPRCPAQDFSRFIDRFAEDIGLQKTFTQASVDRLSVVDSGGSGPYVKITPVAKRQLTFPLPLTRTQRQELSLVETGGDSVQQTVTVKAEDARDGAGYVSYVFTHDTCWRLTRIEDWSIHEASVPPADRSDETRAKTCLRHGEFYEGMANLERWAVTQELYERALQSFLCAAHAGLTTGVERAVSLSLSGQAPRLADDEIEALLIPAAQRSALSATMLARFYCDENRIGISQPKCQADKALHYSIKAAQMGGGDELIDLGTAYAQGRYGAKDLDKAAACYRLAAEQGGRAAAVKLQHVLDQQQRSAAKLVPVACF